MKNEDFIEVIDNVVTNDICRQTIIAFEKLVELGYGYSRKKHEGTSKLYKHDMSVGFLDLMLSSIDIGTMTALSESYNQSILNYIEKYEAGMFGISPENGTFPISQSGIKIQKTIPMGGYHVWHSENSTLETKGRAVAWMLYLNDVVEGGETEFLYQSKRVKPKTGRLVIWPAGWTHTHRGNPPLEGEKYIITGWMELTK
jgi:hypothetical protein